MCELTQGTWQPPNEKKKKKAPSFKQQAMLDSWSSIV